MDSEAANTIHYYPSLHGFCQVGDISMLSSSLRSVNAAVWFGGNPSVLLLFWYCETLQSAKAMTSSQLLTQLSSQRQKVLVTAVRCSHIVIQSQRRSCIHNLICAFNNLCPWEADVLFLAFSFIFKTTILPILSRSDVSSFILSPSLLLYFVFVDSKSVCTFCILVCVLLLSIIFPNTIYNHTHLSGQQMQDVREPNCRDFIAHLENDTGE